MAHAASSNDGYLPPELGDELVRLRARVSNGSAIGMKFPLALGDDRKMAFGGDQGGHVCDEGADAVLVQGTDRDFVIAQGDRTVATGAKSGGWATLGGDLAC